MSKEPSLSSLDSWSTVPPSISPSGGATDPAIPHIAGYDIRSLLAEGGMGQVYRAFDIKLRREVALKVIRPDRLSADLMARFLTEARAVAALDHPHVVHVYEVGEYAADGGTAPYLAMEFVPGGTLADHARRPLPSAVATRVVHLLARAMAHVHGRGIVHRDLKPANVLLAPPSEEPALNSPLGRPKVTDFGLARRRDGGASHTSPGAVVGTPAYMAPEQAEGKEAGPAADVYALGGDPVHAADGAAGVRVGLGRQHAVPRRQHAAKAGARVRAWCAGGVGGAVPALPRQARR